MNKHKAYVKLLQDIAKIDTDAAIYLLKLSKQDKFDIGFDHSGSLRELMLFAKTPQEQAYWNELSDRVNQQRIRDHRKKVVTSPLDYVEHTPITIESLVEMFPSAPGSVALTGYIPMAYFTAHEKEIRRAMALFRQSGCEVRTVYRGPRYNISSSFTRRKDAHSVVIY